MPSKKSARVSERKRQHNMPVRSIAKTYVGKTQRLIDARDTSSAEDEVKLAISALDKAAKKRVIHPNSVARRKSRLMKKLNASKSQER